MQTVIVIPARYGSSRLPGKPLAGIAGRTLIERVWRIARTVRGVERVLVATDDERILEAVRSFGGEAVMTSPECRNGSERVHEAAAGLDPRPDVVINLQGDAPLTPPWVIEPLVEAMAADPSLPIATPAVRLDREQLEAVRRSKAEGAPAGTLVTFDLAGRALYFSKSVIPFVRFDEGGELPVHRHIGIYAYRYEALERYLALEPSPLERAEGLEQLRALEHGIPIQVVPVDYRGRTPWSVDSPEDVVEVERILAAEGEVPGTE
jgi:3-deoxy-manno-octulosonate cytidylyltransferase (CMP-KDO synthetase)